MPYKEALAKANKVKVKRAQIRKDLYSGKLTFVALLEENPPEIKNLMVFEAMTWLWGWKEVKAKIVFHKLDLSEWLTFGNMTERQKNLLIEEFNGRSS